MVKWSSRTDGQSDIKKNSPQLRKKKQFTKSRLGTGTITECPFSADSNGCSFFWHFIVDKERFHWERLTQIKDNSDG